MIPYTSPIQGSRTEKRINSEFKHKIKYSVSYEYKNISTYVNPLENPSPSFRICWPTVFKTLLIKYKIIKRITHFVYDIIINVKFCVIGIPATSPICKFLRHWHMISVITLRSKQNGYYFHTTFSKAFSLNKKNAAIWLKFHWNSFLNAQLNIYQRRFR